MEKIWTKTEIKRKINSFDRWLERAIIAIYKFQTVDEKAVGETHYRNAVGFNGADANYLSYCAQWIQKGNKLSGHHLEKARKKVMKYSGQLAKIANSCQ